MISKKQINDLGFKDIEEYFNYIVDSEVNGNYTQVRGLIKDLSKKQKREFFKFLDFNKFDSSNYLKELLI